LITTTTPSTQIRRLLGPILGHAIQKQDSPRHVLW
jgi:hypothetical protein